MSLDEDFDRACWDAIAQCKDFGYTPTAWMVMIREQGAVAAAKRLLGTGDIQPGFERLVREGRLDLTIEAAILNPRWASLFNERHREAAHWRLDQARAGG